MSSPALRITIGTIGTPACIATWKAPFLNGPSAGVAERVPSGAMTSEMPSRSRATAGASAALACAVLPRSTNAMSARRNISPNAGTFAASFFATPVNPPRSSFARMRTSSWLWWLNRNTAGRADSRYSAPRTESRTPASAVPSSPASAMPRSTPSRREPFNAPSATPAPNPPTMPGRGRRGARDLPQPGPPAGAEAHDRPALLGRDEREARLGVERSRAPDRREERHVLGAVGVRVARLEVDAVLRRERLHGLGLAAPPQRRAARAAGRDAVLDLDGGDEHVLDAHRAGGGRHLEAGGRRREHHGVPGAAVGLDQPPRLRVERARDALHPQPLAQLGELVLAAPRPRPHAEHEEPLEVRLGGDPAQAQQQHAARVERGDVARAQVVAGERAQRVAVDQGAVEVEEGADRGSFGAFGRRR